MTQGAPGGLEPVEQERMTRQLGRTLVEAAGEGWQRVWAQYRSAGKHVEADFVITGADGQQRPIRPPQTAIDLFARLRGGMYRPDQGTWLSATYMVESSGSFAVDFEPDAEPSWRRVPPPIGFQDELRWFPRAEDAIPEWLKVRAGLSPTPAAGVPVAAPDQGAQSGPAPAGGQAPAPGAGPAGSGAQGAPGSGAPGPRPGMPGPGGPGLNGQPGQGPQAHPGLPPSRPPTPPQSAPRPY